MQTRAAVSIRYGVKPDPQAWVIPEGPVPQSPAHVAAVLRWYLLLQAWAANKPAMRVAMDLAVRWLEQYPRTGINPDVCVLSPAPSNFDEISSLKLWETDRSAPPFCVEVVSGSHPYKDYSNIHERYAAFGAFELVVFDPQLFGPPSLGGPLLFQLWRRDADGILERLHAGADPFYSQFLDAWISAENGQLVISEDRAATRRWLTAEEHERGEKERAQAEAERAQAEAERERAWRIQLEQRLQELERSGSK